MDKNRLDSVIFSEDRSKGKPLTWHYKKRRSGLAEFGVKTTEWRHFLSMMVLLIEFQERAAKAGETAASNRNKNGTEDRRENG